MLLSVHEGMPLGDVTSFILEDVVEMLPFSARGVGGQSDAAHELVHPILRREQRRHNYAVLREMLQKEKNITNEIQMTKVEASQQKNISKIITLR